MAAAAGEAEELDIGFRRLYWRVAALLLWVGAVTLSLVAIEALKPKSPLRGKLFRPFKVLVAFDMVFVFLAFLPSHTLNVLRSWGNDEYTIEASTCSTWVFPVIFSIAGTFLAMAYAWFCTWHLLRTQRMPRYGFKPWLAMAIIVTAPVIHSCLVHNNYGPLKGLFCGMSAYNSVEGKVFLSFGILCVGGMFFFLGAVYIQARKAQLSRSSRGGKASSMSGSDTLRWLAVSLTVIVAVTWAPTLAHLASANLLDYTPPWLALTAGWCIKIKPIADSLALLQVSRSLRASVHVAGKGNNDSYACSSLVESDVALSEEEQRASHAMHVASTVAKAATRYEFVALSPEERAGANSQFVWRSFLILLEAGDTSVDLANFFVWAAASTNEKTSSSYAFLYSVVTLTVLWVSVVAVASHAMQMRTIRAELNRGVRVKASVARFYRMQEGGAFDGGSRLRRASMSGAIMPDGTRASAAHKAIVEFEVSRLAREVVNLRFIVLSTLLEDLTIFGLTLWRVLFSPGLMDGDYTACIQADVAPIGCFSEEMSAAVLQVFLSGVVFVYKFGFLRDYLHSKRELQHKRKTMESQEHSEHSMLDELKPGEVNEREVYLALQTGRLLSGKLEGQMLGVAGDRIILTVLRKCSMDPLAASSRLRAWLRWRKQHSCDAMRRRLVRDDLACCEMPGMARFREFFVLGHTPVECLDPDRGVLVFTLQFKLRDVDRFFSAFTADQFETVVIYMCERMLLQLEYTSALHRRVYRPVLLVDGRRAPQLTRLAEVQEYGRAFMGIVGRYPVDFLLVFWKPCPTFQRLVDGRNIVLANDLGTVLQHCPLTQVPLQLRNHVTEEDELWSFDHGPDSHKRKLHQDLGKFYRLQLFKAVSEAELAQMLQVDRQAAALESWAQSCLEVGSMDTEITLLQHAISFYHGSTGADSLELLSAKLNFLALRATGATGIRGGPRSVVGAFNMLRYVRAFPGSVDAALLAFSEVLLWRERRSLDRVREEVRKPGMSLAVLPNFSRAAGNLDIKVRFERDRKRDLVLLMFRVDGLSTKTMLRAMRAMPSSDSAGMITITEEAVKAAFEEVCEFCEYLAYKLAQKYEHLPTLQLVAFLSRAQALGPLSRLMSNNEVRRHYPGLFAERDIVVVPGSQRIADLLFGHWGSLQALALDDRGRERLQKVVDPALVDDGALALRSGLEHNQTTLIDLLRQM